MNGVILQNSETQETMILEPDESGRYPNFRSPWRAITTVANLQFKAAKIAYWANYKWRKCSSCGEMAVYETT